VLGHEIKAYEGASALEETGIAENISVQSDPKVASRAVRGLEALGVSMAAAGTHAGLVAHLTAGMDENPRAPQSDRRLGRHP